VNDIVDVEFAIAYPILRSLVRAGKIAMVRIR
jgi:uncharacterized membrane protein